MIDNPACFIKNEDSNNPICNNINCSNNKCYFHKSNHQFFSIGEIQITSDMSAEEIGNMIKQQLFANINFPSESSEFPEVKLPKNPTIEKIQKLAEPIKSIQQEPKGILKSYQEDNSFIVEVRWFDGYIETFHCTQARAGNYRLWLLLTSGKDRHIPLHQVRWYSGVK